MLTAAATVAPVMDAPLSHDPAGEHALMARVATGDQDAVDALVGAYQDELVGFFFRLSWDQTASEELAQEVFVRLWLARERWRPEARLRTWIYRIAHNLWIDRLRRRRPNWSLDDDGDGEETPMSARLGSAAPAPDPDAAERDAWVRDRVQTAVAGLPEGHRQVFVLAVQQGLKYQEVSEILGIPEGTVKSRMHHAVRALRDELGDLLDP
jgi:RNA polymerase sigma-70 factor (ECF subfamily)